MADKINGMIASAVGMLRKDAETKYLSNGMNVCNFGFFFNVEIVDPEEWMLDALVNGAVVKVTGPVNVRRYTDKNDGGEKMFFTVAGRDVVLLDSDLKPIEPGAKTEQEVEF